MDTVLYVEISIIGIVLLLIMYFSSKKSGSPTLDQRLFNKLLLAMGLVMAFDAGMWLIDGAGFSYSHILNITISSIYYFIVPLAGIFWLLYSYVKIENKSSVSYKRIWLYSIPLLINTVLTLINFKTGWYFYIDEANIYTRGDIFFLSFLLALIYMIQSAFLTLKKARQAQTRAERDEYYYMALFLLPVFIGGIIQCLFFGLSVVWISAVLSLVIIYINIQNQKISTDVLTGLNNRRQMNKYLSWKIKSVEAGQKLFAIIIDIDNFKKINDTFGHAVGDKALVKVANILKSTCNGKNDFLARMGGDEFAVICQRPSTEKMIETIEQINKSIDDLNKQNTLLYNLCISMGYVTFGENDIDNIDAFMSAADKNMYKEKIAKKHI